MRGRGRRDRPAPSRPRWTASAAACSRTTRAGGQRPPARPRACCKTCSGASMASPAQGGQADLPVGLGLEDGDGKGLRRQSGQRAARSNSGSAGSEPTTRSRQAKTGSMTAGRTSDELPARRRKRSRHAADNAAGTVATQAAARCARPPSRLHGAVELDADGLDRDDRADRPRADRRHGERPYPFKVLIGPDNLTANGIDIPDVAGAVVSGTASGDWTLSCVRGQIRQRHLRVPGRHGAAPCRRTATRKRRAAAVRPMAPTATAPRTAAWAGSAILRHPVRLRRAAQPTPAVPRLAGADHRGRCRRRTRSSSPTTAAWPWSLNSNGSLGTVGISGNRAMGRILAGGVHGNVAVGQQAATGQAFAAVYVQPGARSPCTWSSRSTSTTTPRAPGQSPHRRRPCVGSGLKQPRSCSRS